MSKVDKRVVEMNFDNKQFESGVQTSLGTIDKLKKALDFKNAERSLNSLVTLGSKFSLANISKNVQGIADNFGALELIATQALGNITGQAIQTGLAWLESLTLRPARMGFGEYETQMNSIQTIMANTSKDGTVLKNVVDALDTLNTYSDKTIYNFTQMTRNIGTFTAAGVKLDTSVAAIKGIANLAAVSGSNAEQASTAMYQLSQALASGTVKLMDWNSVVNAGMGGKVFQEAIMETARVHGVAIDQMIKEDGSFRETLQRGWFTSEILTETLSKFTGDLTEQQLLAMGYTKDQIVEIIKMGQVANDAATKVKTITQLIDTLNEAQQSGWTKTWQIIVGDFDEAKELMTEISGILGGMIGQAADARNNMLQTWKDLGGRKVLIDAIRKAFEGVLSITKPVKEAFSEIFPPVTGQQLLNLTQMLRDLAERFKIGEGKASEIKRVFKGLFALVDIGRLAIISLTKSLTGLGGPIGESAKKLLTWLAYGGDWIVNLRDQIKSTDAFGKALDRLKTFLQETGKKIKAFVDSVKPHFESAKTFFKETGDNAREFIDQVKQSFSSFGKVDSKGLTTFLDKLKERFGPLVGFGQLLFNMFAIAGRGILLFQTIAMKLLPFIFNLSNNAAEGINGFLDTMVKRVENFDFNKFFDVLNGGLLAALLLTIKKFVDNGGSFADKIAGAFDENGFLGKITGIFDGVRESLEAYQNNLKSGMLLKIAGAIGILALSLVAISLIDSKKLAASLAAMTIMFIQLGVSLAVLDKVMATADITDMGKLTVGLLGLSTAILIMSGAVLLLGKMKTDELGRGLLAVALIVGILATSSAVLSRNSANLITASVGLILFSGALVIMTSAVEKLAKLDSGGLTRGLVGIGILMTELVLFMKATDVSGMGVVRSVGILILAGALEVMTFAVSKLAELDGDKLLRGLLAIGAILAEVSIFVNSTSNATQVLTSAIALTILAGAMLIMTDSMVKLGDLSWDQIARGLVAMAGALLIITVAANLLPKDMMLTGASLLVVASALVILGQSLTQMGDMTWEEVGKGLTAMGGSLLVLAVGLRAMIGATAGTAALLLAAVAIAVLAPALKLLGSMDIAQVGLSLLMLAGVFTVFGIAALVLSESIPFILGLAAALFIMGLAVAAIGIGVAAVGVGILALAVAMTAAAAAGTAGLTMLLFAITGIVGLIPMIVTTIGVALLALLQVLVDGFPLILKAVEILLLGLIDLIAKVGPSWIKAMITIIDTFLVELAGHMPEMVKAGYAIIVALLTGIRDNIGKTSTLASDIIINFLTAMEEKIPQLTDAGYKFIIAFVNGLKESVEKNMPDLMVAVTELATEIIKGLIKGYFDSSASLRQAMWDIAMICLDAIKEALGIKSPSTEFIKIGVMTIEGLIGGIKSMIANLKTLLGELVTGAIKIFTDSLPKFVSSGVSFVTSLISGISSLKDSVVNKAVELITAGINGINNKFQDIKNAGSRLIDGLIDGIESLKNEVKDKARSLIDSAKDAVDDKVGEFRDIGRNVVQGVANGIGENIYKAVSEAYNLASQVLNIIKSVLGISSPSDETEEDAMYLVMGLVGGFKKYGNLAYNAAKDLGKKTLSGLSTSISMISESVSSSLDSEPTIKPVLDLSDIQKSGAKLNSMFGSRTIDVSSSVASGNAISGRLNTNVPESSSTDSSQEIKKEGDIIFQQNNTSPKALTPTEIYRQTHNLLSGLKKVTGAA